MYYNIHTQEITNFHPTSLTLSNGTVITGETFDASILANAGFFTVRNDTPTQPENTMEDISARVINLDSPYVDIIRSWIIVPPFIPTQISARQIRLWLIQNNISLTSVENVINGIVDEQLREKTLVEWEFAPYVERNHPLINTLGTNLGLSSEQIDNAFIQASLL